MAQEFVDGVILDEQVNPATMQFHWGARYKDERGKYILIKFNNGSGNEAAAVGQMLAGFDTAGSYEQYEGTNDFDDGDVLLNRPIGQMMAAPSNAYGVWCQYEGRSQNAAVTDTTCTEGGICVLDAATVGGIQLKTLPTQKDVGVSLQADAAAVLASGGLDLGIIPG